jgi:hypothetical protein
MFYLLAPSLHVFSLLLVLMILCVGAFKYY